MEGQQYKSGERWKEKIKKKIKKKSIYLNETERKRQRHGGEKETERR